MKKFSTAALFLALASAFPGMATANDNAPRRCAFVPDAPDQHTVVKGDTLWDISGRFLEHPWCWPQVWGLNRDQIRDPHWIYPGQIVYFDRNAGRLSLTKPGTNANAGGLPTVRLSPQVRTENLKKNAIPSIPSHVIEPFLSQPLIVGENELQTTARIVAMHGDRVLLGKGDTAFVVGDLQDKTAFQVFRPSVPLHDPETNEVLAYEAAYLGTVRLDREARLPDEAHTVRVVSLEQEMGIGDRLLPVPPSQLVNYVPHAPEQEVNARVVSIYGGVTHAGQNQIVSINRGKKHGLELGHVLTLYRYGGFVADPEAPKSTWYGTEHKAVRLPDQEYGSLFVFRVFDNISYGLVMQVRDSVQVGDVARSPE